MSNNNFDFNFVLNILTHFKYFKFNETYKCSADKNASGSIVIADTNNKVICKYLQTL